MLTISTNHWKHWCVGMNFECNRCEFEADTDYADSADLTFIHMTKCGGRLKPKGKVKVFSGLGMAEPGIRYT